MEKTPPSKGESSKTRTVTAKAHGTIYNTVAKCEKIPESRASRRGSCLHPRRWRASAGCLHQLLGRDEIPVNVVDNLDDMLNLLRAESDENVCRKDLLPAEAYALAVQLEPIFEQMAEKAAQEGREKGGKAVGGDHRSNKAKNSSRP